MILQPDSPLLSFILLVMILSLLMGGMPQEVLNVLGLGILSFSIIKMDSKSPSIISSLVLPIFSWIVVWFSEAVVWEPVFLSVYFLIIYKQYKIVNLFSVIFHGVGLLVFLFLDGWVPFQPIDWGRNWMSFYFLSGLPIFLCILSLVFAFKEYYYQSSNLILHISLLLTAYSIVFLFLNPIFSVFLYFSSLHTNRPLEKIVARGIDFAS